MKAEQTPREKDRASQLCRARSLREGVRVQRHRTEFATTLRALAEYLPNAPARVLDCGSGPGHYAIELGRLGYAVTLFDLSAELLELARVKSRDAGVQLDGFEQGSATDLVRFPDNFFDAALLMGPLYHLLEAPERRQALSEIYRVVKPGGVVFAGFMSRYAAHRCAAVYGPNLPLKEAQEYQAILETGKLAPQAGRLGFETYFSQPTAITPLCQSAGFDVLSVLGVDGLISIEEQGPHAVDAQTLAYWLEFNYKVAADPSIHGAVEHLLAICRKPAWKAALCQLVARFEATGIAYRVVGEADLALRGISSEVDIIEVEVSPEAQHRLQSLFGEGLCSSIALYETDMMRLKRAFLDLAGVKVALLAGMEWRQGDNWVSSTDSDVTIVSLAGTSVCVQGLEELALSCLRLGLLDRAARSLPHCDTLRLKALLRHTAKSGGL